MRRNNRRNDPNDILGLNELLDSWMEMMSMVNQLEPTTQRPIKEKSNNPMSYEDREKDIAFTIDMPGVVKKDINIEVEDHFIKVSADSNGRNYNYTRRFKPKVDVESAVATFKNGVLDIVVKKIEEKKGKKVSIK
jgi:HSP20 family molecular chaperone IbpA|tara:strand:- start:56 stop:460 length:405 start_codon:yes stop_codon:yes gene_type:complete